MKISVGILAIVLTLISLYSASGPAGASSSPIKMKTSSVPQSTTTAGTAWQQRWADTLVEAKKEGRVAFYNTWPGYLNTAVSKPFKDKYGIDLEISPFMRAPDIMSKVRTEQQAGLYLADVFGGGMSPALGAMKPAGLLGPIDSLLILPEVVDPKLWTSGKFPFGDKDKLYIGMIIGKQPHITYNTTQIKTGELTSYKDVLKPQYKGKITLNDPTVAGTGSALMAHLAYNIWNVEEAEEFLRRLIKEQDVDIQRDNRILVESVARGKFAIGLSVGNVELGEFIRLGAPIAGVDVKEGLAVSSAYGGLSIPKRLAHPNATAVFVNWLLSKEGQTVYSKAYGAPSMRNDVSTEGLLPFFVPHGEKLFYAQEEDIIPQVEFQLISKKIIDELRK